MEALMRVRGKKAERATVSPSLPTSSVPSSSVPSSPLLYDEAHLGEISTATKGPEIVRADDEQIEEERKDIEECEEEGQGADEAEIQAAQILSAMKNEVSGTSMSTDISHR